MVLRNFLVAPEAANVVQPNRPSIDCSNNPSLHHSVYQVHSLSVTSQSDDRMRKRLAALDVLAAARKQRGGYPEINDASTQRH
jgi:hypothetical protein